MNKAEELIACLEGEIAKRDAIIYDERIDADLQRQELDAANSNLAGLRAELSACRVAVENCELFRAELAAIKAQGVVMPEQEWLQDGGLIYALKDGYNHYEINVTQVAGSRSTAARKEFGSLLIARLNAAPAQQVSVPACVTCCDVGIVGHSMLCPECSSPSADPEAPAADAGLVEALEKIAAYAPCSGIKDPGFTKMYMGILARDALAARSSKGVV